MTQRVTVEYTKDVTAYPRHKNDDDAITISKGTVRAVDPRSAKKLVGDGVAKIVGSAEERSEAREAIKSAAASTEGAG